MKIHALARPLSTIPRPLSEGVGGALIGALSGMSGQAAPLVGAVAQAGLSYTLDRVDPVQSFRPNYAPRMLIGACKGAASALAGQILGPAVGAAVGLVLGALPLGQPGSIEKAGNVAGLQTMQVPELWQQGLTGKGVGVAVIDSGCAPHPDLKGRTLAFFDTIEGRSPMYDCAMHGTAVATALAGGGEKMRGVAPQANILALRVVDQEDCVESPAVLRALDWVAENRQRYNIQVVNCSFGLEDSGMTRVAEKIKSLSQQGVIVCTSAGNTGPKPQRLNVFKASPDLLTVASVDTRGSVDPADDRISPTSTRAKEGSLKGPDVSAPGLDLVCGSPTGDYTRFPDGGTSLATALTSGVLALWKEALPDLTLEEARKALAATSRPMTGETPNSQGAGLIQARAGLDFLRNLRSSTQVVV